MVARSSAISAAKDGRADVVEALLQAGADVNKAETFRFAPLIVAASAPIAKIVPIPVQREWAGPGAWKGKYDIPDDAFEWSEEELREMFGDLAFADDPPSDGDQRPQRGA